RRRKSGKRKWLAFAPSAELEPQHGHTVWERIQSAGLKDAGAVVEDLVGELTPPLSMESTDEDITRQMQVRASLTALLEKQRMIATEGPVREQFESELRALTDAEQDS